MGIIEENFGFLKQVLNSFNPKTYDSTELIQEQLYIQYEGSQKGEKEFEREYIFGLYIYLISPVTSTTFAKLDKIEEILRVELKKDIDVQFTKSEIEEREGLDTLFRFEVKIKG